MKKHLILWFSSLGAAYHAADAATKEGAIILELFPFASMAHLFLEAPAELNISALLAEQQLKVEKIEIFSYLPEKVLRSYLSLTNPALSEDLLIYEHAFLGETLRVAAQASHMGLELLDIRFMRDTAGHSYFMATGLAELCTAFIHHAIPSSGKIRQIKNPSDALREFFPQS